MCRRRNAVSTNKKIDFESANEMEYEKNAKQNKCEQGKKAKTWKNERKAKMARKKSHGKKEV